MMSKNHSIEYALLGLIYLAKNQDRNVKISEIAENEKISLSFLEKLFQKLSKANIVKAQVGPLGGFQLSKGAKTIKLAEIFKAVMPIKMCPKCRPNLKNTKKSDNLKILNIFFAKMHKDMIKYFNSITLENLIHLRSD